MNDMIKTLQRMDAKGLLEIAMNKIQRETFGKIMMHSDDLIGVLELLNENMDALVKRQKGCVTIMEQKSRKHGKPDTDYLQLMIDTLAAVQENPDTYRKEPPLRQWQIDIMEENAARTGYLFGESG